MVVKVNNCLQLLMPMIRLIRGIDCLTKFWVF